MVVQNSFRISTDVDTKSYQEAVGVQNSFRISTDVDDTEWLVRRPQSKTHFEFLLM